MPPEGPNKSEELLKRYAKERQEQAPNLPLHPATRRLLQGEVTRQFGKKSALENRGWSAWFGIMRGRLAISTAVGAVVVTGVCLWWNNQGPQPMEMAKADRSVSGLALGSSPSSDAVSPKSEKLIALMGAPSRARLEDEVRGQSPAAPTERAIQPELKAKQVGDAPVTIATVAGSAFAIENAPGLGTTSTLFSGGILGRGADLGTVVTTTASFATMDFDSGALSNSAARSYYFGTITGGNSATNPQTAQLAYNMPADGLSLAPPSASLPSVALNLSESKDFSKLSENEKLAAKSVLLARKEGEATDRSRRAALPAQTPAAPAPTPQPVRALGEIAAADKRQQPLATSQLQGAVVAQASAARPDSNESLTRFYRQPTTTTAEPLSKQKTSRDLDRLNAEPAVLSRFVIEQQGNSVRVVDADGSIYEGKVEEPVINEFDADRFETFEEKKDQITREKSVALKSAIAAPAEGYSFRASGSNVTLHQTVVVNGRFAPATDNSGRMGTAGGAGSASAPSPSGRASASKSGAISNRANGAQQPGFGGRYRYATNQPATIEGTVRIGVTNQQWFRAVRNPR